MLMNSGAAERFDVESSDDGDYFASAHLSAGESDFCSREGAHALKAKIEAYWRERGQHVQIMLHNVGFHPAIRAARFDVRSDMINGMPRAAGAKPKKVAPAETYVEEFDQSDDDLAFE
ncbi:MAG: hypothetical protein JNL81_01155 [Hyphomonadaceae bacterium]|nr:hypothetical protein [Hyphomonadaceae bacterium]